MKAVRVKICGIMSEEDIGICVRSGVDALGFVVEYPVEVPWNIHRTRARELMLKVPAFVTTTAVVGGSVDHILSIADLTMPDVIQLHGNEPFDETGTLVKELTERGIRTIKALRISVDEAVKVQDVVDDAQELASLGISALLLDSKTKAMPAGTGVPFSWEIAKQVRCNVDVPLIIAGGLNQENVRDAIRIVEPFAVDVISWVEREPGEKDERKVQAFVQSAKCAFLLRIAD